MCWICNWDDNVINMHRMKFFEKNQTILEKYERIIK